MIDRTELDRLRAWIDEQPYREPRLPCETLIAMLDRLAAAEKLAEAAGAVSGNARENAYNGREVCVHVDDYSALETALAEWEGL